MAPQQRASGDALVDEGPAQALGLGNGERLLEHLVGGLRVAGAIHRNGVEDQVPAAQSLPAVGGVLDVWLQQGDGGSKVAGPQTAPRERDVEPDVVAARELVEGLGCLATTAGAIEHPCAEQVERPCVVQRVRAAGSQVDTLGKPGTGERVVSL